jgi:hypothetical protein
MAWAFFMNGPGDQFLSGAGLTAYQDRRIRIRHLFNQLIQLLHGLAGTNHTAIALPAFQFLF